MYTITKSDGTTAWTLLDGELDTSSTDLTLLGKNYLGYGEIIAENFVHLLENFAKDTPPENPIIGELWYRPTDNIVRVNVTGFAGTAETRDANWKNVGLVNDGTGVEKAVIIDTANKPHTVLKMKVNSILVAMLSTDADFTPAAIEFLNDPGLHAFVGNTPPPVTDGIVTPSTGTVAGSVALTAVNITASDTVNFTVTGGSPQTFTVTSQTTVELIRDAINELTFDVTGVTASVVDGKLVLTAAIITNGVTGSYTDRTTVPGVVTQTIIAAGGSVTLTATNITASDTVNFTVTGGSPQTFTVTTETTVELIATAINDAVTASALTGVIATAVAADTLKLTSTDVSKGVTGSFDAVVVPPEVDTIEGVDSVSTEYAVVTFNATSLAAGESITIAGLTLTASGAITQADVAAGFASLPDDATAGNLVVYGTWSGTLVGFDSGAVVGVTVTFTSTMTNTNVDNIVVTTTAAAPAVGTIVAVTTAVAGSVAIAAIDISAHDLVKFTVTGEIEYTFPVTDETTVAQLVSAINELTSAVTGVNASVVNGKLVLTANIITNGVTGSYTNDTPAGSPTSHEPGDYNFDGTIGRGFNLNSSSDFKIRGVAMEAQFADVAEIYIADATYEAGTLIALGGEAEITQTMGLADTNVFGIISNRPAYLLNTRNKGAKNALPVAVAGRIPVKVTGRINRGDRLIASAIPGVAQAATFDSPAWSIVGRSLGNFAGDGVGKVEATVGAR